MSTTHTRRNFVIAYAVLVFVPILGLVGVLRYGRGLTAPPSVDGVWKLHADTNLATLPCGAALQDSTFTIAQSGRYLVLDFNSQSKVTSEGVLEGALIKASVAMFPVGSPATSCSDDHSLSLTATIDSHSNPKSLTGVLSANDCPSCTPVEIRAVHTPFPARGAH